MRTDGTLTVATFADLMGSYDTAVIHSFLNGSVVRLLTKVSDDQVEVDALAEKVTVFLSTPITYQPWVFDRGSLVFKAAGRSEDLKICTETDIIRYPDGVTYSVAPPAHL